MKHTIVLKTATQVAKATPLTEQLTSDIKSILNMARYYTDEEDKTVIHLVELAKILTTALEREQSLEMRR